MNATEAAQKIIDYLRIENEVKPGASKSDLSEIARIVQAAIDDKEKICPLCKRRMSLPGVRLDDSCTA